VDIQPASLVDLESKVAAGEALTREEVERVLRSPDLPGVGMLGEMARKARSGDRVTYARVLTVAPGAQVDGRGEAGEVRLVGRPASADEACERVAAAVPLAAGAALTGFSLGDLLELVGGDHLALADLAAALRQNGLAAVAEIPLDRLGDTENVIEVVRAVIHGGLGAWRATVDRAPAAARLDLIARAVALQREPMTSSVIGTLTGALKAFAPLPRIDDDANPSTGYDDVRTIAVAALMCPAVPYIQVDWPLHGPKLAQVAITYGANDIDGISPFDTLDLGPRRSPREDVERQIRAAFAVPVARDGMFGS
jgi:aminodeoxyfutalosine synthase